LDLGIYGVDNFPSQEIPRFAVYGVATKVGANEFSMLKSEEDARSK